MIARLEPRTLPAHFAAGSAGALGVLLNVCLFHAMAFSGRDRGGGNVAYLRVASGARLPLGLWRRCHGAKSAATIPTSLPSSKSSACRQTLRPLANGSIARPNSARRRPSIACAGLATLVAAGSAGRCEAWSMVAHPRSVGWRHGVAPTAQLNPGQACRTPPRLACVLWPRPARALQRSLVPSLAGILLRPPIPPGQDCAYYSAGFTSSPVSAPATALPVRRVRRATSSPTMPRRNSRTATTKMVP